MTDKNTSTEPDLNQRPKDACLRIVYSPPLYQLSYRWCVSSVNSSRYADCRARWSRGMIRASGARGPGFDSRTGPSLDMASVEGKVDEQKKGRILRMLHFPEFRNLTGRSDHRKKSLHLFT